MTKSEWTLPIGLAYATLPTAVVYLLIWWALR
jgi:hypothetical protein